MAFVFSMESILRHRVRQEEFAQREFMEARQNLEICLQSIEGMYRKIDESRSQIAAHEKSGRPKDLKFVCMFEGFIEAEKLHIQKARLHARTLIAVLEEKEAALLERLHDRKIMDKLKERRFQEYRERLLRLEQKELDDLTNARQARGLR